LVHLFKNRIFIDRLKQKNPFKPTHTNISFSGQGLTTVGYKGWHYNPYGFSVNKISSRKNNPFQKYFVRNPIYQDSNL
tara:strand:+ start:65 stop:298 length:234 start_codon:yes stop_codon:yes gene_type:complete